MSRHKLTHQEFEFIKRALSAYRGLIVNSNEGNYRVMALKCFDSTESKVIPKLARITKSPNET